MQRDQGDRLLCEFLLTMTPRPPCGGRIFRQLADLDEGPTRTRGNHLHIPVQKGEF